MSQDQYAGRHVGSDERALSQMLSAIGVRSVDELIGQVVPSTIRLKKPLALPREGMSECEFAAHIREIGRKNKLYRSLIGMGYYGTASPAVILRNVFENPAWYTSYTPYQAEISQGRLEALLNFQTAVVSMTGMEVSNCSLLDEATATAEAMAMMFALRSREAVREGRNVLFVDENIFPQTLDVLLTRSEPFGIEIVSDRFDCYEFTGSEFGAIVQYPAADGEVRDYDDFAAAAHSRGVLVTAVADMLSLALLKAPGEWGADIVTGSTQRFGIPMGFGGPHAAYLATKDAFKRNMPGRIIGVSVDRLGNKALRMALQMREQHIKRERATSNICTAQALLATMAGFFAVYHGAEGIRRIALHAHSHAVVVADMLEKLGYELKTKNFFDTIEVAADAAKVREAALARRLNFFYPDEGRVRLSFDELSTLAEANAVIAAFAEAAGKKAPALKTIGGQDRLPVGVRRSSAYLTEPVFRNYRSETELMRYVKKLERRDISLVDSMISLGSCTMKLTPAVAMMPLSLSEFADIHPFVPADQAEGYRELIDALSKDLATITGMAAVSLQPNSGASGEYTGLMVIRAYYQSRGQGYRNVALIPASAHGTNPASAAMAGMRTVTVACDERGNIDVDDLKAKATQYASELCCIMVTYPSTHGVFESRIREIVDIVHDNGGQVYMDGANMNAQVGLTNPGYIGADVCHLNLHKTFAIPHGGGGPGVGPICVAAHLAEFLPGHSLAETGGSRRSVRQRAGSADHLRLYQDAGRKRFAPRDRDGDRECQLSGRSAEGRIRHRIYRRDGARRTRDDSRPARFPQTLRRRVRRYCPPADGLRIPCPDAVVSGPRDADDRADREREPRRARPFRRVARGDQARVRADTRRRSRRRRQSGQDGSPYGAGGLRRYMDSPLWPRAGRVPVTVDSGQQVFPLRDENRWRIRRPQSLLHLRNAVRGRVGRGSRGRPFAFRKRGSRQVCLLEGIPSGIGRVERFRKGC